MLDQMFTAESFRRIFDIENRKGVDLASIYFPNLEQITNTIRDKAGEIRALRKIKPNMPSEVYESNYSKLKSELSTLKSKKSDLIDIEMENISASASKPDFKLTIQRRDIPNAKSAYSVGETAEAFFVVKQLQYNINRIYGVKQSNRHDLSCQIRDTIISGFPFELVRTDISEFYESIDRKRLYNKLDQDQLLSFSSKKYIKQLLNAYGNLSGSAVGLPRGVGISAYLSELFLRSVDRSIRNLPGLVLYCRYVDDIVAIFARPPGGDEIGIYKDIISNILTTNGLSMNSSKTLEIDYADHTRQNVFEYLGYKYTGAGNNLLIAPSDAKMAKLRQRLDATFKNYAERKCVDSRLAFREIVSRIKFLTGNTRLSNSKSIATIGIYYSNSLVNDLTGIKQLDTTLRNRIRQIKRPALRQKLKKYQFESGFLERRFHKFNSKEIQKIVEAWKHVKA